MNLSRQLGLGAAVSLVIGEVIAVGIFLTPAQMARSVGSPFWLLVIWLASLALKVTVGAIHLLLLAAVVLFVIGFIRGRTGRSTA